MPLTFAISETSCAQGRAQPYKHGGEASKNSSVALAAYGLRSSLGAPPVTLGYPRANESVACNKIEEEPQN